MDPREQVSRQIEEAITNIRQATESKPKVGLILGSGFSAVADAVKQDAKIPYKDIAHFPLSTIEGHPGNLIFGHLDKTELAVLQGRFHLYEGYTMWGITFPVRVLASLGVEILIVSGACGGLDKKYKQGQIVILEDHLNLMPGNPLTGPHVLEMGRRFVDMSEPYDVSLSNIAEKAANNAGIDAKTGVYAAVSGPSFETPAETSMLRKLGANVVGMSIAPEVITAKQMGLRVLGLAMVSNVIGQKKPLTHDQVLENISHSNKSFVKLLQETLKDI